MKTSSSNGKQERRWPQGAVVYQIYPRSLQDGDSDGTGDLPGIIERLDYFKNLGVTALWLSPFYPSPMADFGYDITDHCAVDPLFGTIADFKRLLHESKRRGIRVLVDLVPNHTSDEHPWFKESRASRDNPKAQWYVWKNPRVDGASRYPLAPNNWRDALSGESAWEWDDARQQFYLHSFDRKQPDLNWVNQEVRDAIKDVMRFWLDLGVDGFRVDAVNWMAKDPLFRDDDGNPNYVAGEDRRYNGLAHNNSRSWAALYAHLAELVGVLKEKKYAGHQPFMVIEAYPRRDNLLADYMQFYESLDAAYSAPFNFEGLFMPWKASDWRRFLRTFHLALDELSSHSVASYAFGNHDNPRLVTRFGKAAARSAAVMQLTLPGMAVIYYGEEIGMHDVEIPPVFIRDPQARDNPQYSRDPIRTPMQWSAEPQSGFSGGPGTWLPLAEDYAENNVAAQQNDPDSFYTLYHTLIQIRNSSPALKYGRIQVLELGHPDLLGYVRSEKDEHFVVLVNFSGKTVTCVPGVTLRKLLLSSNPQTKLVDGVDREVQLLPHEAALFVQ